MGNRRRQESNIFDKQPQPVQSPMDAATYKTIRGVDEGTQTAFPIKLVDILPDPKQPRRQIPSVIRQQWNGEAQSIMELFAAWIEGFAAETGREGSEIEDVIDLVLEGEEVSPAEVYQGDQVDPKRNWGVLGGSLMAVVNLAAEIRRDGLTNPITVVRVGNQFLIETGERRWLAFHLLHIFYSTSAAWTKIPAREVPASSVWRQAGENTARAQLNAISMARQLAILLMDLCSDEDFVSFEEAVWQGVSDRPFYAQVADGNRYRIPPGKGEQLVNAMGIKSPDMLRKYRALLRLPDEIWALADDLNWEEGFIRTRILEFSPVESLQIAKARQLADELGYRVTGFGHTVTGVTVSDVPEGEPEVDFYDRAIDHGLPEMEFQDETSRVIDEKLAEQNPPTDDEPEEDDEPRVDPSLEYWQEQVLIFAYERAEAGKPWFAAMDSSSHPERLNLLIEKRLLRGSSAYTNTDYAAAHYSIAGAGCLAIGKPFLPTPQPGQNRPVSGGEFHAGNGAPVPQNPPVQDTAAIQKRIETNILGSAQAIPQLIVSAARRLEVEKIKTPEGKEALKQIIYQALEELRRIENRLPKD